MNPKVDWFFEKETAWKTEYQALRPIVLETGLVEELKWGCPCYTLNGKNVVLIHGFKEYMALSFFKGSIMKDPGNELVIPTENSQAGRQLRFTSSKEIYDRKSSIKTLVGEAIAVEKEGLNVEYKSTDQFEKPEELLQRLENDSAFREAFEALTPGRQRGWILHFSKAKQSKTRESRIEKSFPKILEGKGWNER